MVEYLVVVIAPDRDQEKCLLTAANGKEVTEWSCVTVYKDGRLKKDDNVSNECVFVLINQHQKESNIKDLLVSVKSLSEKVIVWTHKTPRGDYKPFSCNSIEEILQDKIIFCDNFSHTSDTPAKPILDFMKSFSNNNNWENRKAILQHSVNDSIRINAKSEAHKLRADILIPFIPFHLYHQLENKNEVFSEFKEILEKSCEEINKKDNADSMTNIEKNCEELIYLKNKVLGGIEMFSNEAFNTLKINFHTSEGACIEKAKKTDCRKTIEAFAESLEEIVCSIENG